MKAGNFKCRYCQYFVSKEINIVNHEKLHPEYMPRSSSQTLEASSVIKNSDNNCQANNKPNTSNIRHRCKLCPYKTSTTRDFRKHMTYHKRRYPDTIKCKHCDFYVKSNMCYLIKRHEQLHVLMPKNSCNQSSKKSLNCQMCPFKAKDTKTIYNHVRKHEYQDGCEQTGDEIINFDEEQADSAPTNRSKLFDNQTAIVLKCRICDYLSKSVSLMNQHEKLHCNIEPVVIIKKEVIGLKNQTHALASIKTQKLNHNNEDISKKLICSICSYGSNNSLDYSNHLKRHTYTENLPKCRYCDYFSTLAQVSKHEKSHPEYTSPVLNNSLLLSKFECPHCPYMPSNAEYLKRHMQRHIYKENTKKCRFCPYYTSNERNMNRHELKHSILNKQSESIFENSKLDQQYIPEQELYSSNEINFEEANDHDIVYNVLSKIITVVENKTE